MAFRFDVLEEVDAEPADMLGPSHVWKITWENEAAAPSVVDTGAQSGNEGYSSRARNLHWSD